MNGGSGAAARLADEGEERGRDLSAERLGMSLQLVRASTLTMTRLHLALQRGDRRLAMMAMDGLLDIDAEMEGLVADLVGQPGNDAHDGAHWQALHHYLERQKGAIAVEKHGLTGLAGRAELPPEPVAAIEEFPVAPPPAEATLAIGDDSAQEDAPPRRRPAWLIPAAALAVLVVMILGAALALGWLPLG